VGDFAAFLGEEFDEALTYAALRKSESVGRPVGSKEWLADMEARTGKVLAPGKRGPKGSAVGDNLMRTGPSNAP
jgi:putative transposase